MITATCDNCHKDVKYPEDAAGQRKACKECGYLVIVPEGERSGDSFLSRFVDKVPKPNFLFQDIQESRTGRIVGMLFVGGSVIGLIILLVIPFYQKEVAPKIADISAPTLTLFEDELEGEKLL